MQPSSLVFVAIIVGWAAYLLPQWLRRRDALGQFRLTDRHSAGLRVLDRRRRPGGRGPSSAPLLTSRSGASAMMITESDDGAGTFGVPLTRATAGPPPSAQAPPTGSAAVLAARRRARVLGSLGGLFAVSWVCALVLEAPVAPAWAATGLLVADLTALVVTAPARAAARQRAHARPQVRAGAGLTVDTGRSGGMADRAEAMARRAEAAGRAAARSGRPLADSGSATTAAEAIPRVVGATPAAGGPRMPGDPRATGAALPPRFTVHGDLDLDRIADTDLSDDPMARTRRAAARVAVTASAWTPRPVPPPTYALKPPAPTAGSGLVWSAEPVPAEDAPEPVGGAVGGAVATDVVRSPAARAAQGPASAGPGSEVFDPGTGVDLDAVLARRRAANG